MTPRHRLQPAKSGGAVRRAVVTSVLSALALTSITITAAAVTLTNADPRPEQSAAAPAATSVSTDSDPSLAPPVQVEDVPVGIPDIALVSADGPQLDAIPSAALAAYQRAAAVLGSADKKCHLEWTLVAAIGHVVTAHGSTAGSELNARGVMRPTLAGKPLRSADGKRIPDSDAGRLDGDGRFDRPVGPMQLSPSAWSVVGVDSDGDGRRNPHDIDDASLAVSVLLCAAEGDLGNRAGRLDGVRRVNDDRSFIETVLAVDRAYRTQMNAPGADPVLVPSDPPTYMPTDLPTDVPSDFRSQRPQGPQSNEPTDEPTDPITWSPTPTGPGTTSPPPDPDPTDTPDPCVTDDVDPTDLPSDTATADPTDVPTDVATDASTDVVTDVPTDEPTDEPTDVPTDDPCPADETD